MTLLTARRGPPLPQWTLMDVRLTWWMLVARLWCIYRVLLCHIKYCHIYDIDVNTLTIMLTSLESTGYSHMSYTVMSDG